MALIRKHYWLKVKKRGMDGEHSNIDDDSTRTALTRQCSSTMLDLESNGDESLSLEALPQDVLIQIAKEQHFAFTTPKKTRALLSEFDEIEALNASKQFRVPKLRISREKLAGIVMDLDSNSI